MLNDFRGRAMLRDEYAVTLGPGSDGMIVRPNRKSTFFLNDLNWKISLAFFFFLACR